MSRSEGPSALDHPPAIEPPASTPLLEREPPRTPRDPTPVPRAAADRQHELSKPAFYLNRELTWLNFNFRVLRETEDVRVPLLERLKFVAIVAGNLDEFYMKRIGGLKQLVGARMRDVSVDGRTPDEQIGECTRLVRTLDRRLRESLARILTELEGHGIHVRGWEDLDAKDHAWLRETYVNCIFPLVTPQATDPAHPFPFISNLSLNLLVALRYPSDTDGSLARVKVPVGAGTPRFVKLPDRQAYVPLESVLANNLDLVFPGMEVESCAVFRVTRNANTELDEETADDLLSMIETELRERKFAPIVRLQVGKGMPTQHREMLAAEFGLDPVGDVYDVEGMLGMHHLWELAHLPHAALHDPPHQPVDHPDLATDRNIFQAIREAGSLLVHHPYQAYATSVERFLETASCDREVRAIKMTLYRTSEEGRTINALIDAARNGKQVAVAVELKARFDEEANIRWANRLEEAGIHVTYGVVGLKTHCKVVLVVRQDFDGLRRYAHLGTGNYHAGTARLYSDLGLFTCDQGIGRDLTELFNYLTTGYKPKRNYEKLLVAPKELKPALLAKIARESAHAARGLRGHIQIKTNALEDADMTRALYDASIAGVKVDLIVRDTCRLRPGIAGASDNIGVVSIVGRFLEHSRVYYFHNAGSEEYYIGSADCMKRNLESRVEVLVPVEAAELRQDLRLMLDAQLADPRGAWDMAADGSYSQRGFDGEGKSSQQLLVEWAERDLREATRLRRRKPRGLQKRNLR